MVFQIPVPTLLLYSIVAAALIIYVPYGLVAISRFQIGYDATAPRAMFDKLPPYAQRATWAHQNAFESFMVYAAAALMAYVTGQNSNWVGQLAIAYVVARLVYPLFYILKLPVLRSLAYGVGFLATLAMFAASLPALT